MLPTILYRSPGPYAGPPVDGKSTTYATLGVKTEAELDAAQAAGWCLTLPGALAPPPALAPAPEPAPVVVAPASDRDALEAEAHALNIKVDGRWSDARLQAVIDAAKAG